MKSEKVIQRAIMEGYQGVMQEISAKVSDAITPVDTTTLPAVVMILEQYAQMLKSQPEFNSKLYAALKRNMCTTVFVCDADDPEAVTAIKDLIREARGKEGRDR